MNPGPAEGTPLSMAVGAARRELAHQVPPFVRDLTSRDRHALRSPSAADLAGVKGVATPRGFLMNG